MREDPDVSFDDLQGRTLAGWLDTEPSGPART